MNFLGYFFNLIIFVNPKIINILATNNAINITIDTVFVLIISAFDQSVKFGGKVKFTSPSILFLCKTYQTKYGVPQVITRLDRTLNPVFKNLLILVYFIIPISVSGISITNNAIGKYIENTQLFESVYPQIIIISIVSNMKSTKTDTIALFLLINTGRL